MLQEEEDHDVEDDDVEVENRSEDRGPHLRNQNALGHSPRAFLCENLQGKCSAPDGKCRASGGSRDHDPHFVRACAIEMHMDMSEEPTCAGIYKNKIPRPRCILRPRPALSTSLRRRNAHGRVTRAILRGNLQGNCRALGARDTCFARACAVDTWTCDKGHFMPQFTGKRPQTKSKQNSTAQTSREPVQSYGHGTRMNKGHFAEIQRENPAPQSEHLDQAPASTLTVRIPQCGYAAWGKRSN